MNQKEFTAYVIAKLIGSFPQFENCKVDKPGDIVDIEVKSPGGNVELWITTQNIEITVGFDGFENLNDWHTHVTTYDDEFIDADIADTVKLVKSIIEDNVQIVYSSTKGYALINPKRTPTPQSADEQILVKYWSSW